MASNAIAFPFEPIFGRPKIRRFLAVLILLMLTSLSFVGAVWLRFDFAVDDWRPIAATLPLLLVSRWCAFLIFKLDLRRWRLASAADIVPVSAAVTVSSAFFGLAVRDLMPELYFPRSVVLIDWLLLQLLLLALFAGLVVFREGFIFGRTGSRRALLVGDGPGLLSHLAEIKLSGRFIPAGIVCADRYRAGEKLMGVSVEGTFEHLVEIARRVEADVVCFVSGGLGNRRLLELTLKCREAGLEFIALNGRDRQGAAEGSTNIELILGREQVAIDMQAVRNLIEGQRVLVTGAGGSIGSELCRQIAAFAPQSLHLVERSENSLFFINRELTMRYPRLNVRPLLLDITDAHALNPEVETARPSVIFHAAAHKHVGMMECRPQEAVRNNVIGTHNVAAAAMRAGVDRFINISTDKAVRPKSYMGLSKRLAEICIEELNRDSATRFATVRFGNVAGSTGSVVQLFRQQIASGGPVTVTDPRARRFFMSIPEAVRLVLQSAVFAGNGGIFVLDMGKPVEIYDLARTMISLAGHLPDVDIPIEFTGLNPAEKLNEELQDDGELLLPTFHDRVLMIRKDGPPQEGVLENIARWQKLLANREFGRLLGEVNEFRPEIKAALIGSHA